MPPPRRQPDLTPEAGWIALRTYAGVPATATNTEALATLTELLRVGAHHGPGGDGHAPIDPRAEGERIGAQIVQGLGALADRLVQNMTKPPDQGRQ